MSAPIPHPTERITFSSQEAADALGVTRTLIYSAFTSGDLTQITWDQRALVRRDEVMALLERGGPGRFAESAPAPGWPRRSIVCAL